MRILLWAALWAALEASAAFAQTAAAPKPAAFDVLPTYPDPVASKKPRILFMLPHELEWRDILAAYSPTLDFDHIPKAQFDRLPKQPIFIEGETPAFDLCRIVPLPLNLQSSSYTYVSEYGLDPLQISGMRVCATFRDEPQEEYGAVTYYGTMVAPLPARRPRPLAGFVLRTPKTLIATPLPREGRQFTVVVSTAAGKNHDRQLTYTFTEAGAAPVRLVREAGSYGQLLRWNSFQVDGKTYLLEISRGPDQTCPYSVTLWQAGATLTPLGSGGDSCDP